MPQSTFNKVVQGQICALEKHARIANEEMGAVKADLAVVKNDVGWLKISNTNQSDMIKGVSDKIWWVLGSVVLSIFITILFVLVK